MLAAGAKYSDGTLFRINANEIINTIQMARNDGLYYRDVRDGIHTHHSMTEAFMICSSLNSD